MNDIWCGVLVGAFITFVIFVIINVSIIGKWYIGDLREDHSSGDEKPYYFMEIAKGGYRQMQKNRYVLLRIKRENYIQQGDSQS